MKHASPKSDLPSEPVDRLTGTLGKFLHIEAASGIVLLVFALTALILANSPFSEGFLAFWKTPVGFNAGDYHVSHSLRHWINDGLMTIFFFVVGLEVKREMVMGELRSLRQATLPVAAAIGGMVLPAALYLLLQHSGPGVRGWGIPMATDIAFLVGCVALLGSGVPKQLRVMLLSIAIVDDIGAILVIAIGYTDSINLFALGIGVLGIALITLATRMGVRSIPIYTLLGITIWYAFHESGIHATLAGVILGLQTPARSWVSQGRLGQIIEKSGNLINGERFKTDAELRQLLHTVEIGSREAISPLLRLETMLHPWVGFFIMPVFAFANAGVVFTADAMTTSVAMSVMAGLVLGKPMGIVLFSWLAIKFAKAQLPEGVTWMMLTAGGFLAGIGFTMALFIADLALEAPILDQAKTGILLASGIAAVIGMVLLKRAIGNRAPQPPSSG
tara:strand:+ start:353 stop:1690 length:1338 start_codon:yes stop_codon:yes gene_type:complete